MSALPLPNRLRVACALVAVSCGSAGSTHPDEASARRVLFDDFSYQSWEQMAEHGWTLRTKPGVPGVPGGSWWKDGISFADAPGEAGNRLLQISSVSAGDAASTKQTQICHHRKYLRGTYAARVFFRNEPVVGPDGDAIVETFYAITPPSEPQYSEIDFEYLANGGWGSPQALWATSWTPYDVVRPKPPDAEFEHDLISAKLLEDFAGWHILVAHVSPEGVRYSVDGRPLGQHEAGYSPKSALSINFNLWFDEDGLLDSRELRQYTEDIDWVYHEADAILSLKDVKQRVAELRGASVRYRDTVPPQSPALPSLCDL